MRQLGKLVRLKQSDFLCDLHPKPNCAENQATEDRRDGSRRGVCLSQKGLFETLNRAFLSSLLKGF
jgi:hypothetical protein